MAQTVKSLPAMRETWVQSLGRGDPLEKEMAPTPVLCLENPTLNILRFVLFCSGVNKFANLFHYRVRGT